MAGLARLNRELIGKAEALGSPYRAVLDMDSTEIPVYGEQGGSEPMILSEKTLCSVGRKWGYIFNRRKAK
jgi:hypothetical protein